MPDTYDYRISAVSSGSMVKLENLATPVDYPKGTFTPYSEEMPMVSGIVRGVGYPVATWNWNVLTRSQRDMLRTFCPGKSAFVYIRTKTMDSSDSYANYYGVMVWPTQQEERDTERRMNLSITFKYLVAV